MATRVLDLRMPSEHRRPANTTLPQTTSTTAPSAGLSVRVDVSGVSHPAKVRPRNEDHFLVMRIGRYLETLVTNLPATEMRGRTEEVGQVMIVADGMGGHSGGEQASRMAITGLVKMALARPDRIFLVPTEPPLPRMQSSAREKGFGISIPKCSTAENRTASYAEWELP